jgi:Reverse transcriptase (RNA-dependent DNA polymerase)
VLAVQLDLETYHIDIEGAYLNGDLDEEIYMDPLKGFTAHSQESKVW